MFSPGIVCKTSKTCFSSIKKYNESLVVTSEETMTWENLNVSTCCPHTWWIIINHDFYRKTWNSDSENFCSYLRSGTGVVVVEKVHQSLTSQHLQTQPAWRRTKNKLDEKKMSCSYSGWTELFLGDSCLLLYQNTFRFKIEWIECISVFIWDQQYQ